MELDNIVAGIIYFFFFKQKTAYEMRISDWSSDVCSSDLHPRCHDAGSDKNSGFVAPLTTVRSKPHVRPATATPKALVNLIELGSESVAQRTDRKSVV